jgi:hypothetical protein
MRVPAVEAVDFNRVLYNHGGAVVVAPERDKQEFLYAINTLRVAAALLPDRSKDVKQRMRQKAQGYLL